MTVAPVSQLDSEKELHMIKNSAMLVALGAIAFAIGSCGGPAKPRVADTLPWHRTLDAALAAAQKDHSLIVADVYAVWCGYCKQLDAETFTDPDVQAKLRQFVVLKLDAEQHRDAAERLGVEGYPTTLIMDETGKVLARRVGFMNPRQYIAFIQKAKPAK